MFKFNNKGTKQECEVWKNTKQNASKIENRKLESHSK